MNKGDLINKIASSAKITKVQATDALNAVVEGIGQDLMSDTISNVCRNIFAEFTEEQCLKYKIPTLKTKVRFYNPNSGKWETKEYNLPTYKGKKIIRLGTKNNIRRFMYGYGFNRY